MDYKELKEAYPELYSDLNPEDKTPKHSMVRYGFETPKGWLELLKKMSEELSQIVKKNKLKRFRIDQVKTKFASLCVYPNDEYKYDDIEDIYNVIRKYETIASSTCELCGFQDKTKIVGSYWQFNLCEECAVKKYGEKIRKRYKNENR